MGGRGGVEMGQDMSVMGPWHMGMPYRDMRGWLVVACQYASMGAGGTYSGMGT